MASDPVGKLLAQLDRDIFERGVDRATVCDKAGLNRGAITNWHLVHKRRKLRGWRMSSWNKIQKVLAEMPVLDPEKPPAEVTMPPTVQLQEVQPNAIFDDTHEVTPIPTIRERIEKLEQMVQNPMLATSLRTQAAQPNTQGKGDDALRDVILDKLLVMDTVKLANLFAYIVNNLKS